MVSIKIIKQEKSKLKDLATRRNGSKKPEWTRRKTDIFNDIEVDLLGLYGEYAVSKYLGVGIDESISISGDSGYDIEYNGMRLGVKYNHRVNGYLMVEGRDGDDIESGVMNDFSCDGMILVNGICKPPSNCECIKVEEPIMNIMGWLPKEYFMIDMVEKDWGLGKRYVCNVNQLLPIEILK